MNQLSPNIRVDLPTFSLFAFKHSFTNGKSHIFLGKSHIFFGKSHIFFGKNRIFRDQSFS